MQPQKSEYCMQGLFLPQVILSLMHPSAVGRTQKIEFKLPAIAKDLGRTAKQ